MTKGQLNRGMQIRGRIKDLKILKSHMEEKWESEIKINGYGIPKHSKEVLLAMCEKEITELETEFENL